MLGVRTHHTHTRPLAMAYLRLKFIHTLEGVQFEVAFVRQSLADGVHVLLDLIGGQLAQPRGLLLLRVQRLQQTLLVIQLLKLISIIYANQLCNIQQRYEHGVVLG